MVLHKKWGNMNADMLIYKEIIIDALYKDLREDEKAKKLALFLNSSPI
jgi:hypothetical protein